ncbi:MAG: helix-turn-helix transcriptional regulator, partial [Micromonosporaceae bacterium]
ALAAAARRPRRFAAARLGGEVAGLALGVVAEGALGVFDVMTAPRHRRRGVATAVVGTRQRPGGRQPEAGPDTGEAGVLVPAQRGDVLATDGLGFVPVRLRTPLTEREVQVLRGMAEGKSNAEIGRDLYVAEDTVKTHARRLFRKLGARDRAHAVAVGFRAGVLP